jgi:hypothetical protein
LLGSQPLRLKFGRSVRHRHPARSRAWSALAAYKRIWNQKWRTAVGRDYAGVIYNGAATNLTEARIPVAAATACGLVAAAPTTVGDERPDVEQWPPSAEGEARPAGEMLRSKVAGH